MMRMMGLLPPFYWRKLIVPALATLVFGPVAWWIADRTPPYVMVDGKVTPNPARPGQELELMWSVNVKRDDCSGWFQRVIVDQSGHMWAFPSMRSTFVQLPIGHYFTHSSYKFGVPDGIAAGQAKILTVAEFECNPIHRLWPVRIEWPTLTLTIVPGQ